MKRLIIVGCLFAATGCTAGATIVPRDGWFEMRGDERGIQAFGDTVNGLVTTGKASPDQDTAYHITRREQIRTLGLAGLKKQEVSHAGK